LAHDAPPVHAVIPPFTIPQGCIAVAVPVWMHVFVFVLQMAPLDPSQSVSAVQAPPTATGVAHLLLMQASVREHACFALQAPPTAAGATHVPLAHTSVAAQSASMAQTGPPSGPVCPAPARVWHVPQMLAGASWQYPLWHCEAVPHADPTASFPMNVHAEGCELSSHSSHVWAIVACAHCSIWAGVTVLPLAPIIGMQASAARCAHVMASP
jgi:hypothetical protein